ncbi:unnamed protein product [Fraxinus pennsylvanica]|uniref:PGG domain-containing protein n=1 Tax=Fraxinus pennsylvanica TaxID=56036 RepID=A0AAD2EAA3_9LAMI|nr:unnamed protein product [Fraxinus pennsylvanica]
MTFVESPLHTDASEGRTGLALVVLLRLKPSLGKKLYLDCLCPLHLALGNGHSYTVRRLVKHDPELIRVQGREGITLLHYAVEKEEIDLLIYFLLICPQSIFDLTVRDETAVHIAVRNENLRAFKVLFGWARRADKMSMMRWRNQEGNTLMHLAALTNQPKVMKSLIRYVHVNEKNLGGKTALDILEPENVEARKILISAGAKEGSSLVDDATSCENYLNSHAMISEYLLRLGAYMEFGLSGDMRNAMLVVVVLVATATFQAILTPPSPISDNDTTHVFPSITSVYNDTTSANSTSTNFNKITTRLTKSSIIYNSIAFAIAMGTCAILTLNRLQIFLSLPLGLFSVTYVALAYGIYSGPFIYVAVPSIFILPSLVILPWLIIAWKGRKSSDFYHEINLDEAKFLIFVESDDNIDLLIRFLIICPSSIKDVTIPVHIAVRNKNLRGFKVLLGWVRRSDDTAVLRCRDEEGNSSASCSFDSSAAVIILIAEVQKGH